MESFTLCIVCDDVCVAVQRQIQEALVEIWSVYTWAAAWFQSDSSENGFTHGIHMHDSDSLVSSNNLFLQFAVPKKELFNRSVSSFPSDNWTAKPLATVDI